MDRINLSMSEIFHNRLREEAKKSGMTISEYIRYAINRLWEAKNGQ